VGHASVSKPSVVDTTIARLRADGGTLAIRSDAQEMGNRIEGVDHVPAIQDGDTPMHLGRIIWVGGLVAMTWLAGGCQKRVSQSEARVDLKDTLRDSVTIRNAMCGAGFAGHDCDVSNLELRPDNSGTAHMRCPRMEGTTGPQCEGDVAFTFSSKRVKTYRTKTRRKTEWYLTSLSLTAVQTPGVTLSSPVAAKATELDGD